MFPLFLCVPLQLPSTGQLPAVRDGPFQTGGVPAVLPALAHRQPERVGRRRGPCRRSSAETWQVWDSEAERLITSVFLFSAAVRRGQGGLPHGGAGCCGRGRRWAAGFSLGWRDCSSRDLMQKSVFCRTFGPLSHPAGYVWKGKTETQSTWYFGLI